MLLAGVLMGIVAGLAFCFPETTLRISFLGLLKKGAVSDTGRVVIRAWSLLCLLIALNHISNTM